MQIYNYGYMPAEDMEIYDSLPKWVRDRLKDITPGDGDIHTVLYRLRYGRLEAYLAELAAEDKRDHWETFNVKITGRIRYYRSQHSW